MQIFSQVTGDERYITCASSKPIQKKIPVLTSSQRVNTTRIRKNYIQMAWLLICLGHKSSDQLGSNYQGYMTDALGLLITVWSVVSCLAAASVLFSVR